MISLFLQNLLIWSQNLFGIFHDILQKSIDKLLANPVLAAWQDIAG